MAASTRSGVRQQSHSRCNTKYNLRFPALDNQRQLLIHSIVNYYNIFIHVLKDYVIRLVACAWCLMLCLFIKFTHFPFSSSFFFFFQLLCINQFVLVCRRCILRFLCNEFRVRNSRNIVLIGCDSGALAHRVYRSVFVALSAAPFSFCPFGSFGSPLSVRWSAYRKIEKCEWAQKANNSVAINHIAENVWVGVFQCMERKTQRRWSYGTAFT